MKRGQQAQTKRFCRAPSVPATRRSPPCPGHRFTRTNLDGGVGQAFPGWSPHRSLHARVWSHRTRFLPAAEADEPRRLLEAPEKQQPHQEPAGARQGASSAPHVPARPPPRPTDASAATSKGKSSPQTCQKPPFSPSGLQSRQTVPFAAVINPSLATALLLSALTSRAQPGTRSSSQPPEEKVITNVDGQHLSDPPATPFHVQWLL